MREYQHAHLSKPRNQKANKNSKRLKLSEQICLLEDRKAGAYPEGMETYLKSKKIGRRSTPQDHTERPRTGLGPDPLSRSCRNGKI